MNSNLKQAAKEYIEVSSKFEKEAYDSIESIVINELGSLELKELYNMIGGDAISNLLEITYAKNISSIKIPDKNEFRKLASASMGYYFKHILRMKPKEIQKILKVDNLKEIFSDIKRVNSILIDKIERITSDVYRPGITEQNKEFKET